MKKLSISLLGAATACLICVSSVKADLFVSGDSNILDPLVADNSNGAVVDTGNQQFFINVLGGGNSVAVWGSALGTNFGFDNDANQFYNGLAGKSSTVISGTFNSLAGYNLLIVSLPDAAFTPGEITVLNNFLAGGNSIFFLGENSDPTFTTVNAAINNDLTALGSSMQIVPNDIDSGWNTATGAHIIADPFTAGVTSFSYAAVSTVSGGNEMFFTSGRQPFVAYTVPEPSSLLLLGSSLLCAIGLGRKFRK